MTAPSQHPLGPLYERTMREVKRCKKKPGRLCFCEECNRKALRSQREAIQWLNRKLREAHNG